MATVERVLVVGGGLGGLTLAIALQRQGFRPELVEQSPVWQATGAAIQLHGNAMRILRALGLSDAVEQAGTVLSHWRWCDRSGAMLFDLDLEALWGQLGPCVAIDRPQLQQVLLGGATVPCRLGTAVVSVAQDEQRVQVGFGDGSTGEYELVVGADGIASTVRTQVLGLVQADYTGWMMWRCLVPVTPRDTAGFRKLLGDRCFFGITPLGAGRPTNMFGAVAMPRTHDPVPGRLARLRERFANFGGQVQECLAAIASDEQLICGPAEEVRLDHWHRGRVVLIGDAAHAGAPTMAQLGTMALEDAYVLAALLRGSETVERALERYEARRKPRVAWVQQRGRDILEHSLLPSAERDPALRESGSQMLRDYFSPLSAVP